MSKKRKLEQLMEKENSVALPQTLREVAQLPNSDLNNILRQFSLPVKGKRNHRVTLVANHLNISTSGGIFFMNVRMGQMQCFLTYNNEEKYELINLDETDEVTIGRSSHMTVCFLSTRISKRHAVLKKKESGTWTILDTKSANGVFVNNKKIEPMKLHELKDGDKIQLAVRTSPEAAPEFVFKYHSALKVYPDTTDGPLEKRPRTGEIEQLDKKDAAARLAEMIEKPKKKKKKLQAKENVNQKLAKQLKKRCRARTLEEMRLKMEQLKKRLCSERENREKDKKFIEELQKQQIKLLQVIDQKHEEALRAREDVLANLLNYIEKMVEQFSGEMKKKRQELVHGRKVEEVSPDPEVAAEVDDYLIAAAEVDLNDDDNVDMVDDYLIAAADVDLSVSDNVDMVDEISSDSSDDSNSNSGSDLTGDSEAYYEGYGRCATCGSRGHWSNGCPLRQSLHPD